MHDITYFYFRPIGTAFAVAAPRPHRESDEGRDHPEIKGAKLRPDRKHQQFPQPLRTETHQCEVRLTVQHEKIQTASVCSRRSFIHAICSSCKAVLPSFRLTTNN